MNFHPEKCTVLRISSNKRNLRQTSYYLHGHCLEIADSAKYHGVTISDDLQWGKHVQATAAKASRTLGFLRRNFRDCSKRVRETTYKTMVRPTMEYASSAWDPHKAEDINCLDKVNRRAARYVCNNYTERTPGCVQNMLSTLGWESLVDRRKILRLTMMFKITHHLVEIPEANNIIRTSDKRTRGTNRLFVPFTKVTLYQTSFFPRSIQDWNHLPTAITEIQTLEAFKTALHARIAAPPPSLA